ncbi:MAG: bifunctional tetrahydrofolate synthase/dihydrofolate synthase [Pseudomonadales bacterium]
MDSAASLADWLSYLERQHPAEIELGLDRVRTVAERLLSPLNSKVITVAGTNGKGSTVRLLQALLNAHGYRVATFTSPHLIQYNERVCIDGQALDDQTLCSGFAAVEAVRNEVPLTYFEFSTLGALWCFAQQTLDYLILEIGLGGRLDSVNVIDSDIAVITSVQLDHQDWLGDDLESIGFEKAGIMRRNSVVVCGPDMPKSVLAHAESLHCPILLSGADFSLIKESDESWSWQNQDLSIADLPEPHLPINSLAIAIQVLLLLLPEPELTTVRDVVAECTLAGRNQHLTVEDKSLLLDVAHNPAAAILLADRLQRQPVNGRTHVLLAMLKDKDWEGVVVALKEVVDGGWFLAELKNERALPAAQLADTLYDHDVSMVSLNKNIRQALRRALSVMGTEDRLLVCGSFYTVAGVLELINAR